MNFNETIEVIDETFNDFVNEFFIIVIPNEETKEYYNGALDFKNLLKEKIANRLFNRYCKTCGTKFYISDEEIKWLEERKLKPFTHCSSCRIERRKRAEENV